jgi:hypothetical protein
MAQGVKPEFDAWRQSVRLTDDQEQLILGSTLGNLSIMRNVHRTSGTPSEYARFHVSHVEKDRDYVEWKYSILGDLTQTPIQCRPVNQTFPSLPEFKPSVMCEFRSCSLPCLRPLHDLCYSDNGRRKITRAWMERLDSPIALAAWFMDSGIPVRSSWHVPARVQITVPRTDYEGAEIVRKVFLEEGCGFEAVHYVQDLPDTSVQAPRGHQSLGIGKREDIREFVSLVKPYVEQVPSMMRKIIPLLSI